MEKIPEIITMGESMALVYPDQPVKISTAESLKLDMAGAESNLAIALSRINHSVRFISRIGSDPFGEFIRNVLNKENVVLDALMDTPGKATGLFFREWLSDGQRRVYYYRNYSAASTLSASDLKEKWFDGARILHLTGITPSLSRSCHEACIKAIEYARKFKLTISFDPNYRAPLWDHQTARKTLLPLISMVDILLLGHEDAKAICREREPMEILKYAKSLGPEIVVLKQADKGAIALNHESTYHVDAYPVEQIADPVGAGDGFDAGYLAGYLRGWDMVNSLELAAKIGALAVTTQGDYHGYPYDL